MDWDTFYRQHQARQPNITWDEYYKNVSFKAPVYTTEMLYNTQAKPKTKFTETDFQPLNIEWKFDWSQYGSYDETDPTEQLRKIRNVPPYSIVSTYDFSDSEDKKRFEEGLPSKALESRILSTQARKEARAYLQERQRLFEDLLKQKQSEKILGIIPKPKVQKIEPEEYEPEEIPATIAAWRGYQQALEEYQKRLDAMTPEEYEYRKLIGALPKPPEPPLFEPPEEFKELDKDLWEEYIRKQEEERRKARQATSIPVTKRTEPPTSSTPTTPSPQSSGIEALKQIAEKYPVTLSGPVYRGELERAQQQIPQRPVQQAPSASEIKKPTIEKSPGLKFLEDFFKIDKDTIKKYTEATKEITSSDKVTWGDVLKNIYKSGVAKTGASYTKTVRTLLGWLPDNIEWFISGGRTLAELQREMEQFAVEAEIEMAEATPTQKFIYTGASETIPLLTNFLLSRFLAAPSSEGTATTVAQKIGRVATGLAERAPYMAYFYGSYASEAEREGATPEQQVLYGIVGATIETVTEAPIVERMLGGGISKTIVNKMMKTGGKTLVNRLGRIGVETLFDIGIEAGQEILAGLGSNISKKLIYAPDTELINPQQIGEDAYGGMAMAVILSALGLPMRYKAHQMAEDTINSTAKGEKVTAQRIIELADQTKQDLNSMSLQEKAELTKTVTEEAKTVDEILQLPVPSEETVARMQFDNALNIIREQLSTYTTQSDLDTETRNRIRDTVIANINIATQLSNQYGFELPNYIKNATQFLQQQPTTVQQPSQYANFIGQQVKLKPPYGNVTVTGETDTHILVDKNGQQKRILKNAFDRLLMQEVVQPQQQKRKSETEEVAQPQQQPTDVNIQAAEQAFLKTLGRSGRATYKKWVDNENIMAYSNPEIFSQWLKVFQHYYEAGRNGIHPLDIKYIDEEITFPPFIVDVIYQAGQKDAQQQKKQTKATDIDTSKVKAEIKKEIDEHAKQYGRSGRYAFNKDLSETGIPPGTPDWYDFIAFFEKYYFAGYNGEKMPAVTMYPQQAHIFYEAGQKDAQATAKTKKIQTQGVTQQAGTRSTQQTEKQSPQKEKSDIIKTEQPAYVTETEFDNEVTNRLINNSTVNDIVANNTREDALLGLQKHIKDTVAQMVTEYQNNKINFDKFLADDYIQAKANAIYNQLSERSVEDDSRGLEEGGYARRSQDVVDTGAEVVRTDTARQSEGELSRGVQSVQEHRGAQGMGAQQDSDSDKSKESIRGTHTEELAGRNRGGQKHEGTDGAVRSEESSGSDTDRGTTTAHDRRSDADSTQTVKEQVIDKKPTSQNFVIKKDDDVFIKGGKKTRYKANVNALRTLIKILSEERLATPEEQAILAQYSGWGALPEVFSYRWEGTKRVAAKQDWAKEFQEVQEIYEELSKYLSPSSRSMTLYEEARESTQYAHYTSPAVIRALYRILERMGFKGGSILEPALGIGNFFGLCPFENSRLYGVEKDPFTGTIAKQLYPNADIRIAPFQNVAYPDNFFDVIISNVPFSDIPVRAHDVSYKRGLNLHNYFFAKALDKIKPGGVIVFITSTGTLDARSGLEFRRYLANKADLIAAFRLPNNTFEANAGTRVTTDVIVLRKLLPGETPKDINWAENVTVTLNDKDYSLSRYYHDHPEMLLGQLVPDEMYASDSRLALQGTGEDVNVLLNDAIEKHIPQGILSQVTPTTAGMVVVESTTDVPEGAYYKHGNKIYVKKDGKALEVEDKTGQLSLLVDMKALLKQVLAMQTNFNVSDADLEATRSKLKATYDRYVKQYGHPFKKYFAGTQLRKSQAEKLLEGDPELHILKAIEIVDVDDQKRTVTVKPSAILTRRTYTPYKPIEKVNNAVEGLAACLNDLGRVDIDHIAKIANMTPEQVIAELGDKVYLNPEGSWETAEEYLSGNVRAKLQRAREAVALDPRYERNVKALEKVQPEDIPITDINVRIGEAWVPVEIYKKAIADMLDISVSDIELKYEPIKAQWSLKSKYRWSPSAKMLALSLPKYGINANRVIQTAMNDGSTKVTVKLDDKVFVVDYRKGFFIVDEEASRQYRQLVDTVKNEFRNWILQNPDAAETIARLYNDTFNNLRPRQYDGSILTFPGLNSEIKLRDYQKNAVARIVFGGNTLLAHAVGSGKTFEQIVGIMECKRLGFAKKPLLVVPNNKLSDYESDFRKLYPNARILVLNENDFSTHNLIKTLSLAATNEWDCVIIRHSSLQKIPVGAEIEANFIRQQIHEYELALASMKDDTINAKQLAKSLENLRDKLEQALQKDKLPMPTFEEIGFDMIVVDEAHFFKNLPVPGKLTSIKGLAGAKRDTAKAFDLLMKVRHVSSLHGGKRGVVFATGTPATNSVAEIYVMLKYLRPDLLEERGISHFDEWARTFADLGYAFQFTPTGQYKQVLKFISFKNLPELYTLFSEFTDIKLAEDLKLPIPKLDGGKPIIVECSPAPSLKKLMDMVDENWEQAKKDKTLFRYFKILRNAPVDVRLSDASLEDWPDSKVNNVVRKVKEVYDETAQDKGVQVIFLNEGRSNISGFDLYQELIDKLVAAGIPRKEIALTIGTISTDKLERIYEDANEGKIRVIIGSQNRLGTGVNIQKRLFAIHEMDVCYRPADIEQGEGRMLRPGNMYYEKGIPVRIYRYVTKGSDQAFSGDAYMWQLVENKIRAFNQFMRGDKTIRELSDDDTLDAGLMKAIASGNPLILERIQTEQKVKDLRAAKRNFLLTQLAIRKAVDQSEDRKYYLRNWIWYYERTTQPLLNSLKPDSNYPVTVILGNTTDTYTDRKKANAALGKAIKQLSHTVIGTEKTIAKYKNFLVTGKVVEINRKPFVQCYLQVYTYDSYDYERYQLPVSFVEAADKVRVLDNFINSLPQTYQNYKQEYEQIDKKLEEHRKQLAKPFEKEEQLQELEKRLTEIDVQLGVGQTNIDEGSEGDTIEYDINSDTAATNKTQETVPPQYEGQPDPTEVMGFVAPGMNIKRIPPSQGYQFDDLELEAQYQADYGLPKETFVQKVKDNITELWHMATRTYKEIPENDPYYAEAVHIITQMNNIANISKDETVRTLDYITDGLNRKEFDVFSKYLYLKDMEESIARGEAIRKGWNHETVQNELKRIEPYLNQNVRQALDRRRERLQSVTQDLINAMAQLGIDLSDTFNRQDYFRHQVLEYAHAKNFANYSSGAKIPRKRGFMYERTGKYTGAYNTNYLEAEYEVLAQMIRDTKKANLLKRFMDNYDISAQVRQTASEQGLENWKDAIPEGYTTYQLKDGNAFYTTTSIADQIVAEILNNLKDGAVVKAEDLKTVLAVGGKFKEYVIKEELANKLENLFDEQPSNVVASASRAINNSFKQWVTKLNPFYFVKFNLRNLSGDWPRALSANYRIVKPEYLKRALSEVKQAMFYGSFTPEMLQWTQRGGFAGLLVPQETQDVGQFFPEYEREKAKQVFNMLYKAVPKTVKGWINFTEKTSIYREAILKYAAFLHYLDAQKAGKPDYGAAPPAMIRGLKDPVDRAFVLSEYAIGAYSRTSELGRLISRHLIPFWRFSESNFKAHYQLLKNAVDSSIIAEQLEYKGKPVTPINKLLQASLNLSTKIALIAGLGLITYVFNALVFPEEEELLPDHVKDEPHIILGTDSNGRIIYFTRVGALHDVLEWAIDTGDIVRLITGETTVSEVAKKMPKKTLQKVVDSLSPFYKLPFELVSGRRLYPDALRPSNIRDRALYVWQSLGLEWLGREVLGLPNRDIQVMLQNIIAYQTEPDAAAYQTILDRKREFEQEQGKYPTQVYNESPKSYALYNYKLALKYKDYGTAKKFLDLYYKLGGTRKGLKQSMNTLSPIYGLSGKELREFEKWLSESDRKKLKRAMRYYKELKDLGQSLK